MNGVYSDQVYRNVSLSLKKFLKADVSLKAVDIRFLEEFDSSKHYKKPFLLISVKSPELVRLGIDGGFWEDEVDTGNQTVDTIHARLCRFDFQLDLGTNTAAEREEWGAIIDRVFEDVEDAGIPVYDLAADPVSVVELGRMMFNLEDDLAHNLLPEIPSLRTRQDSVRFTPDYIHKFIKVAGQEQLLGVELYGKRN